jgi:hypothetical protein
VKALGATIWIQLGILEVLIVMFQLFTHRGEYMAEEVTNLHEVKTASDGSVKISVEKYEELLRKSTRPTTINRTEVIKTAEMAAREYRLWGGTFMGLGTSMFIVGAVLYKAGRVS